MGYTLKVTSGSLTPVTTDPIDVTNAPADHLVITQANEPPSTVIAGQTFGMTSPPSTRLAMSTSASPVR